MTVTPDEVTRLLTAAGYPSFVPKSDRPGAPKPCNGFCLLPCSDGSVYVTWRSAFGRKYEPAPQDKSAALTNATAYVEVLEKAGYQVGLVGVYWHSAHVRPAREEAA